MHEFQRFDEAKWGERVLKNPGDGRESGFMGTNNTNKVCVCCPALWPFSPIPSLVRGGGFGQFAAIDFFKIASDPLKFVQFVTFLPPGGVENERGNETWLGRVSRAPPARVPRGTVGGITPARWGC